MVCLFVFLKKNTKRLSKKSRPTTPKMCVSPKWPACAISVQRILMKAWCSCPWFKMVFFLCVCGMERKRVDRLFLRAIYFFFDNTFPPPPVPDPKLFFLDICKNNSLTPSSLQAFIFSPHENEPPCSWKFFLSGNFLSLSGKSLHSPRSKKTKIIFFCGFGSVVFLFLNFDFF